jgi:hypothetical protein
MPVLGFLRVAAEAVDTAGSVEAEQLRLAAVEHELGVAKAESARAAAAAAEALVAAQAEASAARGRCAELEAVTEKVKTQVQSASVSAESELAALRQEVAAKSAATVQLTAELKKAAAAQLELETKLQEAELASLSVKDERLRTLQDKCDGLIGQVGLVCVSGGWRAPAWGGPTQWYSSEMHRCVSHVAGAGRRGQDYLAGVVSVRSAGRNVCWRAESTGGAGAEREAVDHGAERRGRAQAGQERAAGVFRVATHPPTPMGWPVTEIVPCSALIFHSSARNSAR